MHQVWSLQQMSVWSALKEDRWILAQNWGWYQPNPHQALYAHHHIVMQNRLRITSNRFSAWLGVFGKFCVFYFCIHISSHPTKRMGRNKHWWGKKNTMTHLTQLKPQPSNWSSSCLIAVRLFQRRDASLSCAFPNHVLKILGISTGDWKHPIQSDIHDPFNEPNCRESSYATRNHSLQGTNHISPPSRWIFGSLGPV